MNQLPNIPGSARSTPITYKQRVYANLKVSKATDLYMKVDMSPWKNNEFFILFKNVFKKSWVKLGKSLPAYGLKLDDHTSFIRGGYLTSITPDDTDLDIGLFLNPQLISIPVSFETGLVLTDDIRLNIGISNGFITSSNSQDMVNYSASLNFNKGFNNFSLLSGISYMKELDINSTGIFGGFSINKLTFSYELDQTRNWINLNESMATYAQMVY